MTIHVVARDHLKPECKKQAIELIKELVAITRTEEGNISYGYYQDIKDPNCYAMIEIWKSEEALDKHLKSEHFTRIIPQLSEMCSEPSRLEIYREFI